VAIALQNARLYDEAQRSAYQAALVNAVNQRIQQAPTIDEVLQIAARELGQATGALNTTVQISHLPKPLAEHDHQSSKGQISGQEESDWGMIGSL
jgi:GAF domain-containing protein